MKKIIVVIAEERNIALKKSVFRILNAYIYCIIFAASIILSFVIFNWMSGWEGSSSADKLDYLGALINNSIIASVIVGVMNFVMIFSFLCLLWWELQKRFLNKK